MTNTTQDPSIVSLLIFKEHLIKTGFMTKYDALLDTTVFNVYLNTVTNQLTFQREKSDIIVDFSLTGLPDVNMSAATSGDVLVYNGSNWENKFIGDILDYTNAFPSTRFPDITNVTSVTDALNKVLYPFIQPTFSEFRINSKPLVYELGEYLSTTAGGSETFVWEKTDLSNISTSNGYKILDVTNSYTIENAILPNSSTSSLSIIPYGITKTVNNHTNIFSITGKDTEGNFFSENLTLTWNPRIYWGTSPNSSVLNSSEVISLTSSTSGSSSLESSIENSFTMSGNGEYIWLAIPQSFGKAIETDGSLSRFFVGNMYNSYWNLYSMSFTNQHGFISPYYLYRSISKSFGVNIKIDII